ncbi:LytR/AlgR family response regulator transcription factor [Chitinilyticum piscinae]|uniref:Response regulator transcription factor n=1 Tax=Chitinilyticum piscinae TaxID=2866724 RepID=A0A8J7K1F9_9NEIS|nr:LytTR family DNA-binding domain-containing protein [Chitinilyticum piscinae]MBE9608632.1 response regulator transcription factor [Chitinilyticum piscinae]
MPTALLADDEPHLCCHLQQRLQQLWPELQILATAGNGVAALAELNRLQPDYAFLDIRMPGLTGLQVAQAAQRTRVIFVTAYDDYALAAFEASAIDYLLKPVSDARLIQCISKLQQQQPANSNLPAVLDQLQQHAPTPLTWLSVGLADTTRLVHIDEVLFFQATDKYTEVVTAQERHLIRTPLKHLLPQLDASRFAQIHRATIVNLAAIARIERDLLGRQLVYLKNRNDALPLSRSYAAQFRQM